jgi:hypothetical protein
MNVAATGFFDAHLRGSAAQMVDLEGFPEVRMQTNLQTPRVASR